MYWETLKFQGASQHTCACKWKRMHTRCWWDRTLRPKSEIFKLPTLSSNKFSGCPKQKVRHVSIAWHTERARVHTHTHIYDKLSTTCRDCKAICKCHKCICIYIYQDLRKNAQTASIYNWVQTIPWGPCDRLPCYGNNLHLEWAVGSICVHHPHSTFPFPPLGISVKGINQPMQR